MPSGETNFHQVQYLTIDADHAGRRVDNFLFSFLKNVPKGRIYKMLRKGEVRVNKKRVSANYRLAQNDNLRIPPVFLEVRSKPRIPYRVIERLETSVLYEDDTLLIINKPSGIPVHAGSGCEYGVIEAIRTMPKYTEISIELVHRLDRETSGCLILAKKPTILRYLNRLSRDNQIEKHYRTLVKGSWKGGPVMVDAPLLKNVLRGGERIVKVCEEGKDAYTQFTPVQQFSNSTLLDVDLYTGRTHQIRVHAAHLGQPIAGDSKYGASDFNKEMKNLGLSRLFLHASQVSFALTEKKYVHVEAPLPEELQRILDKLS